MDRRLLATYFSQLDTTGVSAQGCTGDTLSLTNGDWRSGVNPPAHAIAIGAPHVKPAMRSPILTARESTRKSANYGRAREGMKCERHGQAVHSV